MEHSCVMVLRKRLSDMIFEGGFVVKSTGL